MIFDTDFSWNGPDAQELRRSILDGSFRYCNELKCPHLINNDLSKRSEVADPYLREIIDNSRTELPKGPQSIILAYDTSCNLSCPSCRDKVYAADSKTTQYFNETMDKILPSLLIDAKKVQFSQVGEALASLHHRRLLKSIMPSKYPNLTITLMTNLKLISQRTWEELGSSADCIKTLLVSIDGATPQTLERLRRGLTWQRVIEAMEFLREMRKNGKIDYIVVIFIVQKDNFRELSQMLEFCSLYYVDHLTIARISSHGSYTNEQFRDIDVGDPSHPFNGEYHTAIENFKVLHKQMENSKRELLGLGRSIPTVSCQTI